MSISGFRSANIHSSLYCNPLHYTQQLRHETPPNVSWLCGPPLHPYAALAAAAAAAAAAQSPSSTTAASNCWFPYPPFLQSANVIPPLAAPTHPPLISPPISGSEIHATSDDSMAATAARDVLARRETASESAFNAVQASELPTSGNAHMTKGKIQNSSLAPFIPGSGTVRHSSREAARNVDVRDKGSPAPGNRSHAVERQPSVITERIDSRIQLILETESRSAAMVSRANCQ